MFDNCSIFKNLFHSNENFKSIDLKEYIYASLKLLRIIKFWVHCKISSLISFAKTQEETQKTYQIHT